MSFLFSRRSMLASVVGSAMLLAGCQTTGGLSSKQIAGLKTAGFEQTVRGYEYVIPERLLFDVDSSDLRPEQKPAVSKIGQLLVDLHLRQAAVEGHSDSTGSDDYNLALSQRRANSVGDEILAAGFPRTGLVMTGLGEAYPVESNDTEDGRRENRRVVILITAR